MATVSNIYLDQGADFSSIISLKNQDGTPLNLAGFTVKSEFRKSYKSSSSTAFVVTIYNSDLGKIRLQLPAASSSVINAGRYLYDVEVTAPTGERKRALQGIVVISPEITRS